MGYCWLILNKVVGQEKYRSITQAFYCGTVGIIFVFDLSKINTVNLIQKWIDDTKDYDAVKLLVGNKKDLNKNYIYKSSIEDMVDQNNLTYIETSAKTSENIDYLFNTLAEKIKDKFISNGENLNKKEKNIELEGKNIEKRKKKNCC